MLLIGGVGRDRDGAVIAVSDPLREAQGRRFGVVGLLAPPSARTRLRLLGCSRRVWPRLPATPPTGHVNKLNALINKGKNNKRHGQVIGSELRGAAVKGMAVRSTGGLAGSRRVVCGAAVTN